MRNLVVLLSVALVLVVPLVLPKLRTAKVPVRDRLYRRDCTN